MKRALISLLVVVKALGAAGGATREPAVKGAEKK